MHNTYTGQICHLPLSSPRLRWPKQERGIVSQGILFDIGFADGIKPALALPERPVPEGSRAG